MGSRRPAIEFFSGIREISPTTPVQGEREEARRMAETGKETLPPWLLRDKKCNCAPNVGLACRLSQRLKNPHPESDSKYRSRFIRILPVHSDKESAVAARSLLFLVHTQPIRLNDPNLSVRYYLSPAVIVPRSIYEFRPVRGRGHDASSSRAGEPPAGAL